MRSVISRARHIVLGCAAIVAAFAWIGTPMRAGAEGAGPATYVGAADCKKCHFKQWKTWKVTKMALAMDTLKPGAAKDEKTKFGLDPAKDYTTDAKCLKCHTTGFGEPGGYAVTDDAEHKAAREGVQCEDCHGAGSAYSAYMKDHEKAGYVQDDALRAGLHMPDAKTCAACHRGGADGSPTVAADAKFDFDKESKKDGAIHAHPPKKDKK